ncbi:hypothetical protein ACVT98_25285 [Vibrio campbellii]
MIPVEVGDVSGPAAFSWTGNVDGVIDGDTFTLTGIGGSELVTKHALQFAEDKEAGTYDISSVKAVTVEAHHYVEGATPDDKEVGGLVSNPISWSLGGFSIVSTTSGADLGLDKLDFKLATMAGDTPVPGDVDAEAPAPVEGNHTVELSFKAEDVAGLVPGDEVAVAATLIATAM